MHVLFLLSSLLVASAMGSIEFLPGDQLQELRVSFREELRRLIDLNSENASPALDAIQSAIERCNRKLESKWFPCEQCVRNSCGEPVAEELEAKFAAPLYLHTSERGLSSNFWNKYNQVSSWTSNVVDTVSDSASNVVNVASDYVSNTVNTASNAVSNGWKKVTGLMGRRRSFDRMNSLTDETRRCLISCAICRPFHQSRRDLVITECGGSIFRKFQSIAGRISTLKNLMDVNNTPEMPLLVKVALVHSSTSDLPLMRVYARFPAGVMMYQSRVPFHDGSDIGVSLANEFFSRITKEHEY